MVAVGVVSLWTKRPAPELPPEIYRAEAMIEIGMKLRLPPINDAQLIGHATNLVKSIPVEYDPDVRANMIDANLMKLSFEGIDKKKIEGRLKGMINRLIADHLRIHEDTVQVTRDYIEKIEAECKELQEYISQQDAKLKEMDIEENDTVAAALVMIAHSALVERVDRLKKIQLTIFSRRLVVSSVKDHRTKMIGVVKTAKLPVVTKVRKSSSVIIMGGIVGLVLSMFLAFFMEYLNDARKKEKGDKNDRS
jgi:LPS O-antigen subunit length determinant protein (WzzB/FepE family)